MRRIRISPRVSSCIFFVFFLTAIIATASGQEQSSVLKQATAAPPEIASGQQAVAEHYAELPLSFEANQGQADGQVRFLSRGTGYSFYLTRDGATLTFAPGAQSGETSFQMQLAGANASARIHGLGELPGKTNYFLGSDSHRWFTGIPTYSKVAYENIYPGISLVYYGSQRQLEYDFVVSPGANPKQIRLSVSGAQNLSVDAQGNLVLSGSSGNVQLLAPKVYQQVHGRKQQISGQWNLLANNVAGFRLGTYDRSQPLVIDPVLMYSSFLGGSQKNSLAKIAIDKAGNAYVAGYTSSGDFPAAPTPMAMTFGNGTVSRGAFVAKIDPTGKSLLYSTYLSGSNDEEATGLAIDSAGDVYVAGTTHSTNFPTLNAMQAACATHTQGNTCSSAFLTKIAASGSSLIFSTYLGGSGEESARSLAVDAKGSAYVIGTTSSPDFPVTAGAAQTKCAGTCQQNAFLAKFDPNGSTLTYATYLGGSGVDDVADLALDAAGNVYLAGKTTSPDFPSVTPFQKSCTADSTSSSGACLATAFLTKVKADGSAFVYSTYLGGSLGSQATAIAVDKLGAAYVTGSTQSADFPVLKAYQKSCALDKVSGSCSVDAFLTKFSPTGQTLIYSTYVGGSGDDEAFGIAVDASNEAYLIGTTTSADLPTVSPLQKALNGTSDAFVARFNATGSKLDFATFHGGSATESATAIAIDGNNHVYLAGQTTSTDFPTQNAFQTSCAGNCASSFVTKMNAPPAPATGTTPQTITVTPPGPPASAANTSYFTVAATADSGLAVAITTSGGCSGSGTSSATITMTSGTTACSVMFDQAGDITYAPATEVTDTVNANAGTATTISVTSVSPASENYGQNAAVTITAQLSWTGGGPAPTAANVSISGNGNGTYGSTSCGSPVGTTMTCTATYTPNGSDTPGNYTESASFSGDSNYGSSSSSQTNNFSIGKTATTINVTGVSPASETYGQDAAVTITAQLTWTGSGIPPTAANVSITGTGHGTYGSTSCGAPSGNTITCTATYTPNLSDGAGNYTESASFSGDSDYSSSSSSQANNFSITPAATTVALTPSPATIIYGQSVTFTGTVSPVAPGGGTPVGTLAFTSDGIAIPGCSSVTLTAGSAVCQTTSLTAATAPAHSILATYTETGGNFVGSASAAVPFAVSQATPTTAVSGNPNPSSFNQGIVFTATVTPPYAGTATGNVTFSFGSITLCSKVTLTNQTASCTYSAAAPPAGQGSVLPPSASGNTIMASYSGDSNFVASSGTKAQVVTQTATMTTASAYSPLLYHVNPDQTISFSVVVVPAFTGMVMPTGTVTFMDGTTTLGSGSLSANKATFTTSAALSAGPHAITAVYGGDTNFVSSTSGATPIAYTPVTAPPAVISGAPTNSIPLANGATGGVSVTYSCLSLTGTGISQPMTPSSPGAFTGTNSSNANVNVFCYFSPVSASAPTPVDLALCTAPPSAPQGTPSCVTTGTPAVSSPVHGMGQAFLFYSSTVGFGIVFIGFGTSFWSTKRRELLSKRSLKLLAAWISLALLLAFLVGCGGGFGGTVIPPGAGPGSTPAGSYSMTVLGTGSDGSAQIYTVPFTVSAPQ